MRTLRDHALFGVFALALACMLSATAFAEEAAPLPRFIVHLETGPKWDPELPPGEQTQFREHSANMNRLRNDGTILFGARYGEYGLLILEAASLQSVAELLDQDPGVAAGIFKYRVEPISIFYQWKADGG